jgi:hypothetical protein
VVDRVAGSLSVVWRLVTFVLNATVCASTVSSLCFVLFTALYAFSSSSSERVHACRAAVMLCWVNDLCVTCLA